MLAVCTLLLFLPTYFSSRLACLWQAAKFLVPGERLPAGLRRAGVKCLPAALCAPAAPSVRLHLTLPPSNMAALTRPCSVVWLPAAGRAAGAPSGTAHGAGAGGCAQHCQRCAAWLGGGTIRAPPPGAGAPLAATDTDCWRAQQQPAAQIGAGPGTSQQSCSKRACANMFHCSERNECTMYNAPRAPLVKAQNFWPSLSPLILDHFCAILTNSGTCVE